MQRSDVDVDLESHDLGPLAWVLDELRKSLDAASSALRRFVRDAQMARGSDMASLDAGQLRIARQQLHQAVGALEMVGMEPPAVLLRAMEAAVQRFVQKPELCTDASAADVERAGFALHEFLEGLIRGRSLSAVALFPQYKSVQEAAGADRIHPADLWGVEWRWADAPVPAAQPVAYGAAARARVDHSVLRIVKSGDRTAAAEMAQVCLGLRAAQSVAQPRAFWGIAAGFFEALATDALPADVYVKRAASRVLLQYASLAKGDVGVSDRLAQDLVFFCGQAQPSADIVAPSLRAVRQTWNLDARPAVDYNKSPFGRFDPVVLAQARKRIAAAHESWAVVSGGDLGKLRMVADQFQLVADSLTKLHPSCAPLSQALARTGADLLQSSRGPTVEVAMEVATSILYLEAVFQDLDPGGEELAQRTARLAERLEHAREGRPNEGLEPWMEELYRRVSDRQTMGSVVGELRATLSELEKQLDIYFRDPTQPAPIKTAPNLMAQMKGVLSVLGLDQAARAVSRMRETVEGLLSTQVDPDRARAAGTFDKLGTNLGAMGFLIDMLSYQPALAKRLFSYDDNTGELRQVVGRATPDRAKAGVPSLDDAAALSTLPLAVAPTASSVPFDQTTVRLDRIASDAELAEQARLADSARQAAAALEGLSSEAAATALEGLAAQLTPSPVASVPAAAPDDAFEEDDLLDIFLEEAREVVGAGLAAVQGLRVSPSDAGDLTSLRRSFHTLKGSSRMVGLNDFGEAAWSLEQVMNTWLADQKPANAALCDLSDQALQAFGRWVEDISGKSANGWSPSAFRKSADALREHGQFLPLELPAALAVSVREDAPAQEQVLSLPESADSELSASSAASALPLDLGGATMPMPLEPGRPPAQADSPAAGGDPLRWPEDFLPASGDFEGSTTEIQDDQREVGAPSEQAAGELLSFDDLNLTGAGQAAGAAREPVAPAPVSEGVNAASDQADLSGLSVEVVELGSDVVEAFVSAVEPATGDAQGDSVLTLTPDVGADTSMAATTPVQPVEADHAPLAGSVDTSSEEEQTKVIGSLRISIPLYNVFLNEADERSRTLGTVLEEWALERQSLLPDTAVALAHALAGSSATVGFGALSEVARALEHALERSMAESGASPSADLFNESAAEIRRLLHQFAAGFLKDPDPGLLQRLRDHQPAPSLPKPTLRLVHPVAFDPEVEDEPPAESPSAAAPEPALEEPAERHTPETNPSATFSSVPEATSPTLLTAADVESGERVTRLPGDFDDGADDIDAVDAVDPDLFPIFEEEAAELMPQLDAGLRNWRDNPQQTGARDQILRVLHTLKGSARLAGALRLGEMAHRMESEVEGIFVEEASGQLIEPLLGEFDAIQAAYDRLRGLDLQSIPGAEAAPVPEASAPRDITTGLAAERDAPNATMGGTAANLPELAPVAMASHAAAIRPAAQLQINRAAANQSVRVRAQLLDRMVNQAGEVMMTRSRLESQLGVLRGSLNDLTGNLDKLRVQLRDIELQAESQMQSRMAQTKDMATNFDPLEFDRFTRVQELTRMMAESVNDIATVQRNLQRSVESTEDDLVAQARQARELQRDLLRTRMVEFEGIADRLYRVVRLASKETGKQVRLDITGGNIEMDRGVLDRMTPAFEHLLRNCVAHGIEAPAQRLASGKDATGQVLIRLAQEGNDVSVDFQDDGAGLNLDRIRAKAEAQGLVTAGSELSSADAANLIFMPGFSTANEVTELAGRGIGMDVVRSDVNALGGRIETATEAGKGTRFRLVLPLTTAVTQVVMLRSGSVSFGTPANLVEIVRRVPPLEVDKALKSGEFEFAGEKLPFYWSGALLHHSARSDDPAAKTLPVVIFRSAAQRVAVQVDEVLGNQEVVVKNLGPQLSRLPGLSGMTVLASGAVVLIYNPVALATVYGSQAHALSASGVVDEASTGTAAAPQPEVPVAQVQAQARIPLVLVVDDSITVRRVTQRLLQREGYRVSLANDGLHALERLAEELPTVVLSDIEMPRMDGFDLARNIRVDARTRDLPIIMITSRIAQKHRDHATELGVNHYLGKPYSEDELLALLRQYTAAAQPA